MAQRIGIAPVGPHVYRVTIQGFKDATRHRVSVPPALLSELGLGPEDEERLVQASIEFLLEREQASSILGVFELGVIGDYFPEYSRTMRAKLCRDDT